MDPEAVDDVERTLRNPLPVPSPRSGWETAAARLGLTPKEIEVVRAIMMGDGEKQAAARLGITRRALHARIERLYARLGVRSRTELVLKILSLAAHI